MPIWNTVIITAISICLLHLSALLNYSLKVSSSDTIVLSAFILLLLVVPTLNNSRITLFIRNSLFPIFLIYKSFLFHAHAKQTSFIKKKKLSSSSFYPLIFRAFIFFPIIGILETYIRIFAFSTNGKLSISRIISIDFLFAAIAVIYIYFFLKKTAAHYTSEAAVDSQNQDLELAASPNAESIFYYSFCSDYSLTRREQTILIEMLNHATDKQISTKLIISSFTVSTHVHNILKKTGTKSRQELCKLYETSEVQHL